MKATNGISIVIPTLNGGDIFSRCLRAIKAQDYTGPLELIVVDSGSSDRTVAHAREIGAKVNCIAPDEFHHAGTRNFALQRVSFDRVVFMVQDALPATSTWLKNIDRIQLEGHVVAAYGRPTAHESATVYGRFTADGISRYLGPAPRLQTLSSAGAYERMSFEEAYQVARLDNVCAVYRRDALLDCPFPDVPYAEDMAWALKVLLTGAKILYDPSIIVRHSHERAAAYIFRRHVVDAVYCAEILGKLRCDMSALSVNGLICLTNWAEVRMKTLLANEGDMPPRTMKQPREETGPTDLFSYIAATYSEQNINVKRSSLEQAQSPATDSGLLDEIKSRLTAEIDYLWNFVKKSYTLRDNFEVEDILEKITASVLGKFYGDAYASHAHNGRFDPEFHDFIKPYLRGI